MFEIRLTDLEIECFREMDLILIPPEVCTQYARCWACSRVSGAGAKAKEVWFEPVGWKLQVFATVVGFPLLAGFRV